MLRSELISGANRVRNALRLPSMAQIFRGTASAREAPNPEHVLAAFRDWFKAFEEFGKAENAIIDFFDLEDLLKIQFWNRLFFRTPETPEATRPFLSMRLRIRDADEKLPQFTHLLQQGPHIAVSPQTKAVPVLRLILPEQPSQFSTPTRIIEALDSISTFYKALSTFSGLSGGIEGLTGDDLVVVSCDSGSEKSFDFTGVPQIQGTKIFRETRSDRKISAANRNYYCVGR
jgi:hypothetical protein